MTTRRPGCAYLSARAILEHPRYSTDFVIFDAVIHYTPAIEESPNIICSFRYFNPLRDVTELLPGSYDIFAKVAHHIIDVVGFLPYTHKQSPLRPIPSVTNDNQLLTYATPPRLIVSGRVSAVQSDLRSFSVTISQVIRGSTPNARLPVRGLMGLNPMWPRPNRRLPAPNSTIAFSGDIISRLRSNEVSSKRMELLIFLPVPFLNIPVLFPAWAIPTCLQYTKRRFEEELPAGIYEVVAKVVAFERDTHPRSPVRYESEFLLMGDILTLHPLPSDTDALANFDYPARIFASGTVSSAHMPWRASPDAHLQIRAVMTLNPQNPQPNAPLPSRHVCIALTGPLLAIEEFKDPLATIAVDDVTVLPHHSNQTVEPFALDLLASH
ncbi:hypothetical protein EDB84DRAFT_1444486 [Lactarius hengduanensis]|nr:hypothetical protein EDB84DRAFT_1444486 [Lactarius hengduanensis]